MKMRPMRTAPTDGTRVLIEYYPLVYSGGTRGWVRTPHTKIEEARFIEGKWESWCGDRHLRSSNRIQPVGWRPR